MPHNPPQAQPEPNSTQPRHNQNAILHNPPQVQPEHNSCTQAQLEPNPATPGTTRTQFTPGTTGTQFTPGTTRMQFTLHRHNQNTIHPPQAQPEHNAPQAQPERNSRPLSLSGQTHITHLRFLPHIKTLQRVMLKTS